MIREVDWSARRWPQFFGAGYFRGLLAVRGIEWLYRFGFFPSRPKSQAIETLRQSAIANAS
jgi:hypothetical protein